jgi:hypothetical protein
MGLVQAPKETSITSNPDKAYRTEAMAHTEIARYLNADMTNDKVQYISKWALGDEVDLGKALKKIKDVQRKTGQTDDPIGKMYNYIRIHSSLHDTKSKMDAELKSIDDKYKQKKDSIKDSGLDEIEKLKYKIAELEERRKRALKKYRMDKIESFNETRKRYEKTIIELTQVLNAYRR